MPRILSSTQACRGEDEDDAIAAADDDEDDVADDPAPPEDDPDDEAEGLEAAAVTAGEPVSAPPDGALFSFEFEDEEGSLSLLGFLGLHLNFEFLSDA